LLVKDDIYIVILLCLGLLVKDAIYIVILLCLGLLVKDDIFSLEERKGPRNSNPKNEDPLSGSLEKKNRTKGPSFFKNIFIKN
jgi:hypothetical protein